MFDPPSSIDDDLRRLRLETNQLQILVRMLADEPPEVRDVWHWQWDGLMERVEVLHRQHRDGQMSEAQAQEFLSLSQFLNRNHTLVEAMGCRIPPDIIHTADASM